MDLCDERTDRQTQDRENLGSGFGHSINSASGAKKRRLMYATDSIPEPEPEAEIRKKISVLGASRVDYLDSREKLNQSETDAQKNASTLSFYSIPGKGTFKRVK